MAFAIGTAFTLAAALIAITILPAKNLAVSASVRWMEDNEQMLAIRNSTRLRTSHNPT